MDSQEVRNSNAPATEMDKADFERQQPYDPKQLKRFNLWKKRDSANLFGNTLSPTRKGRLSEEERKKLIHETLTQHGFGK